MQHQRLPIDRPDYQHLQPPAVVELDEHGAHATEVRSRYDGMVRIVVTPTWAKLIDVETTLPTGVEELVRQRA